MRTNKHNVKMSQINVTKTQNFNNPPTNMLGYGFLEDGTPVRINADGTTTPLSLSENAPENIIANLGVDVAANLPAIGSVTVGDVYVTSDTYQAYTAADAVSWSIVDLSSLQFITDSVNTILYQFDGSVLIELTEIGIQTTGTTIAFDKPKVYNTATTPATGNITLDQTDAKLRLIQKFYHNGTVEPTYSGVPDIQKMTSNNYVPNKLNMYLFEWTENNRVEYHIIQEG